MLMNLSSVTNPTSATLRGRGEAAPVASPHQIDVARDMIAERYGFRVGDSWCGQLALRLVARTEACGRAGINDYLHWLQNRGTDDREMVTLVESLLIGETHFMRTAPHFAALRQLIVPAYRAAYERGKRLRIASLGCSTGEEPYSLAMVLMETLSTEEMADVEISGVDVNSHALTAARAGCYESFQLRDLTEQQRERWFTKQGDQWLIKPIVRSSVRFLQHNLLDPLPFAGLDVIFCRNVLIYFPRPMVGACLREFHAALRPGGYLILGHSESAFGFPEMFEPVQVPESVIYQRNFSSSLFL